MAAVAYAQRPVSRSRECPGGGAMTCAAGSQPISAKNPGSSPAASRRSPSRERSSGQQAARLAVPGRAARGRSGRGHWVTTEP